MARPLRIEYPGALYHITDRGNERKSIYRDDADRRKMMKYIAEAVEKYSLIIHAFCLMENHYHFEIETPRGNLSQAMHWLKTAYAVYFNKHHKRNGHLFQGRFLSALVEKETHLMALTRYIHLNPVRAGMVERPEDYLWSSYREYIRTGRRWEWLEIGWTLDQFGGTSRTGRQYYRQFVEEGILERSLDPMEESTGGILLGSDRFVEWVQEHILNQREDKSSVSAKREIRNIELGEIIRHVGKSMNVSEKTTRVRGRHGNDARDLSVYLAYTYCDLTNVMIGKAFGEITRANVTYILKKVKSRLNRDQAFFTLLKEIEENSNFKA